MENRVVGDIEKFTTPKDGRKLTKRSKVVQQQHEMDKIILVLKDALDFIDYFVDNYYDLGYIDELYRSACDLGDEITTVLENK